MATQGVELRPDANPDLAALRGQGVGFVVAPLGSAAGHLTPARASAQLAAGLAIVSVYGATQQTGGGAAVAFDPSLFEDGEQLLHAVAHRNGVTDGKAAHALARAVGQPAGSAIYFEVAADVSAGIAYVLDYFRGIASGLAEAAGGEAGYRVGVYGSGFVLDAVHAAGLAEYKWLAAPQAWQGSAGYAAYDIRELEAQAALPDGAAGASLADDVAPDGDFGQWTSSSATPNLVVNDLALRTPAQPPGGTVTIGFAVGNAGSGIAAVSKATLYLSADATVTEADLVLGVFDLPSLAAGGATTGSLAWTIPAELAPGTYHVGLAAAPVPGETSVTDNAFAIAVTVADSAAGSPNMVINALALGAGTVAAGGVLAIGFEVGNAGASPTPASTATLYLSTDATITAADTFLGAFPLPALAPQAAWSGSLSATIPAGLAEGTYYIGVAAGPVPGEANANDNIYAAGFKVGAAAQARPNLVINDLAVGAGPVPAGGTMTVGFAVGNAGGGAAPASTATLYLSTDAAITAADQVLGSFALPELAPGAASGGQLEAAIPSGTAEGTYYIGVVAEPVAGEPNVFDNAYAAAFTVGRVAGAVSIADVTVTEGDEGARLATFIVTRTGGTAAFTVDYATGDGGAVAAEGDYEAQVGTLAFGENVLVRTVTVPVNGDRVDEAQQAQTFFVRLSGGTGGVAVQDGEGRGTILDDDRGNSLPEVVGRDVRVHAGQAVAGAALVLSAGDADDDAIREYAFRDVAAGGGWLELDGVAQPAGSWIAVEAASLGTLAYVGGAREGSEFLDVRVFDGIGWSQSSRLVAETIADGADDYGATAAGAGSVGVGLAVAGTIEAAGDADWFAVDLAAGARYRFDLEGAPTEAGTLADPLLALWDAGGGSLELALDDDGGTGGNARLVFTAPRNDTFYLAAASGDGGAGSYRLGVAELPFARLSVQALAASRAEGRSGATEFTFTVSRTGDTGGTVAVDWAVSGSGAHPASAADFAGGAFPAGSVTFLPGETSRTIAVPVAGDTLVEEHDSFTVAIGSAAADVVVDAAVAGGVIRDDDSITDLVVFNTATGQRVAAAPRLYDGPVAALEKEIILLTPENLNVTVSGDNWFIHTGAGMDAVAVHGGRNVVDGGTGSNFLRGAGGEDAFFLDLRGATAEIWSTVDGFGVGDSVTLWGVSPEEARLTWLEGLGVAGYTGLTLQASAAGRPDALVTLAGFGREALDGGALGMVFAASEEAGPYLHITRLA